MKIQKMSFKNIKEVLTKEEMKKIMAGSQEPICQPIHLECVDHPQYPEVPCCPGLTCRRFPEGQQYCYY